MKLFIKYLILFLAGGIIYYGIEMIGRGRSHWTMIIVGGICFLICGGLNEVLTFEMSLLFQGIICSVFITAVEFVSGCILNLHFELGIWDYSRMPMNLLGQICLPFSLLWILIGIIAVVVDDYLRYWLFREEKPHYKLI